MQQLIHASAGTVNVTRGSASLVYAPGSPRVPMASPCSQELLPGAASFLSGLLLE
jgi:hypothetical protein